MRLIQFCLVAAFFLCCELNVEAKKGAGKPNIVIILADDLGYADVGFHGSDIKTPNIDNLASQGVKLESFYSCPMCSPTRAGLMTGRYPLRFGMMRAVIPPYRNFGLNPAEDMLPEMLERAGYNKRACFGKWHLGHSQKQWHPNNQGFTHFVGCYNGAMDYFTHLRDGEVDWHKNQETVHTEGYITDLITDEAVGFINSVPKEEPYFLYVPYTAPHSPFQAKDEDIEKYPNREGKKKIYAAMVDCMDQGIGRILEAIDKRGDRENTFILFFSDNGGVEKVGDNSPMKGGKLSVFEGGIRVVAAAHWPAGGIDGGKTINEHMGYIDVFPTIKAIAKNDEKALNALDGINVLELMKGKESGSERTWFTYLDQNENRQERFALHRGDWKVILERDAADATTQRDNNEFLYQLDSKHKEKNNLKEENPALYQELTKEIEMFLNLKSANQVRRYGDGKKGFVAPKDWVIE